jgi:uncharacterized protein DUF4232
MTVTARSRRVPLTGAALAAAALLAAGCSSSSSSSSVGSAPSSVSGGTAASTGASPAAGAATAGAPSSGAGTATAGAPSSGAGTAASSAPECTTANLHASVAGGNGAAGSVYTTVDFTNTGSHTCTLYGYPGTSLANSGGPIGAPATRDRTQTPTTVTLAPGAKANAVVRVINAQNYPSGTCSPDSASFLLIYPPNQTQALDVPYKSTGCKNSAVKVLSISPVTSGAGNPNG